MLNKIIYTILGIGLTLVFIPLSAKDAERPSSVSGISTQAQEQNKLKTAPEMALNQPQPELSAHAALAFDLDSGTILYSRNLDEKLPIASLTKLMTAIVVVKKADLNAIATIRKSDLTSIGSTVGLVTGETIKISDLLSAMLIPSGNDAALALANFTAGSPEKFALLMNEQARELNLVQTHFSNPVGWDSFENQENFSNALDMIKVVKEFLKHEELRKIVSTQETIVFSTDGKYSHQLRTTNKLLLNNPEVVGVKTGFTSKALGNLVILVNHGDRQVLTVVLASQNREQDTQKLLDWLFVVYKW